MKSTLLIDSFVENIVRLYRKNTCIKTYEDWYSVYMTSYFMSMILFSVFIGFDTNLRIGVLGPHLTPSGKWTFFGSSTSKKIEAIDVNRKEILEIMLFTFAIDME